MPDMNKHHKIVISAGELSGDEHAAGMVRTLLQDLPNTELRGMGGHNMRECGVETIVDSETSASVMGFGELFGSLSKIWRALGDMKQLLEEWQPDLLVTVDYQEFHFQLLKHAKKLGIPTLHFVSPSIWAWRSGRVEHVKKYVDRLALVYPFEREMYEKVGYNDSVYVGHPFADEFKKEKLTTEEALAFREEIGLSREKPTMTLFLGSRKKEIKAHSPAVLGGLKEAKKEIPDLQTIMPLPKSLPDELIQSEILSLVPDAKIIRENSIKALQAADFGIIKSGTSNLQAAFCGLPFTMFYLGGYITDFIVRYFVPIKQYSIVNIVKLNTVKEIIQENFRVKNFKEEIVRLYRDKELQQQLKSELLEIASQLSSHDPHPLFSDCEDTPQRVAKLILEMLDNRHGQPT